MVEKEEKPGFSRFIDFEKMSFIIEYLHKHALSIAYRLTSTFDLFEEVSVFSSMRSRTRQQHGRVQYATGKALNLVKQVRGC